MESNSCVYKYYFLHAVLLHTYIEQNCVKSAALFNAKTQNNITLGSQISVSLFIIPSRVIFATAVYSQNF